jgi:hypothetical protein
MKRKPKKTHIPKSRYVIARERVKKQLLLIKTALKRTIIATQHESLFSFEEFSKVLGVSQAIDAIIQGLGV